MDSPDLLDQVDLAGDVVVAVEGDGRLQGFPPARDLEVEALQVLRAELGLDRHAQQGLGAVGAQLEPVRLRDVRGLVDRAGNEPGAAELNHQPRGDPLPPDGELGMELLLESVRGVRAEAELPRGAEDVDPVPIRDLEQDPSGLIGDLRDPPSHDPGDP
jgi:hypothetical protein